MDPNVDHVGIILQMGTAAEGITGAMYNLYFPHPDRAKLVRSEQANEAVVIQFPNTVGCTVDGVSRVMNPSRRDRYCRELKVSLPIHIARVGMTFHIKRLVYLNSTHTAADCAASAHR